GIQVGWVAEISDASITADRLRDPLGRFLIPIQDCHLRPGRRQTLRTSLTDPARPAGNHRGRLAEIDRLSGPATDAVNCHTSHRFRLDVRGTGPLPGTGRGGRSWAQPRGRIELCAGLCGTLEQPPGTEMRAPPRFMR